MAHKMSAVDIAKQIIDKEIGTLKKGGLVKGRKSKQKGRILKKMSCDCRKGEHDNGRDKKLFGCECVITSMGKRVKGEKFVSDVGVLDVSWINSPNQYGEFTTNY